MSLSLLRAGATNTRTAMGSAGTPLTGNSIYVDGAVDTLTMTQANFGNPNSTKVAWCGTLKMVDGGSDLAVALIGLGTDRFTLDISASSNGIMLLYLNGVLSYRCALASTQVYMGEWIHVAVIIDTTEATAGNRCKFYINGELLPMTTSAAIAQNTAITFTSGTATILEAGHKGYLYKPAMIVGTTPSITDLYDTSLGVPKDISGITGLWSHISGTSNAIADDVLVADWTAAGDVTTSSSKPTSPTSVTCNKSLYLSGSTIEGLSCTHNANTFDPSLFTSTKLVLSAWVKKSNDTGTHTIISSNQADGGTINFKLSKNAATSWDLAVNLASSVRTITFTPTDSLSTWFHICAVVDTTQATEADRMKVYINGSALAVIGTPTYPAQNDACTFAIGTGRFSIASAFITAGYTPLVGYLCDPAVFDGTLGTPPTVSQLYNNGTRVNLLPFKSKCRAYWGTTFDVGSAIANYAGGFGTWASNWTTATGLWSVLSTAPTSSVDVPA